MAKPSMFSRNYRKQIKRRRIIMTVVLTLTLFGITLVTVNVFNRGAIFSSIKNSAVSGSSNGEETIKEETSKEETTETEEVAQEKKQEDIINKEISLNNSEKVFIAINASDNKIKDINIDNNIYSKDVSPSKQSAIIYNKSTQTVYYIDKDFNVKDITYKQYITTKGVKKTKESVLAGNPKFVWVSNPRFVSENLIVYTSQVPWFETNLYLWSYNLSDNSYRNLTYNGNMVSGDTFEFQSVNEKGLVFSTGGNSYVVTPDGNVIK